MGSRATEGIGWPTKAGSPPPRSTSDDWSLKAAAQVAGKLKRPSGKYSSDSPNLQKSPPWQDGRDPSVPQAINLQANRSRKSGQSKEFMKTNHNVRSLESGNLKIEIHADKKSAGAAAAYAAAEEIRRLDRIRNGIGVIFATGASQLEMLAALTSISDLPWDRVTGFHMDEYIGLDENHPASFRRYLREQLTRRVNMHKFFEIDGNADDVNALCLNYIRTLNMADPQLCLLGIGENGHLAFNDPSEAMFDDPQAMKVVTLDNVCRGQQVAEGWFKTLQDVPERALTLTIPTLLRVPKLICSVPGSRKATVVRRTLEEPITTECPSTILRTHPDVTIYLDLDSATELKEQVSPEPKH
jgi:glucosamine-6-phosphate deaminase